MSDSSLLVEFATWIDKNKEWVFSGVGVIVVPALINKLLKQKNNKVIDDTKTNQPVINVNVKNNNHSNAENNNQNNVKNNTTEKATNPVSSTEKNVASPIIKDEDYYKNNTKILIIDDEIHFKLPKIFKDSGWINTKLIPDVNSLSCNDILNADILFVDVQGVGKELEFKDEGLGLVEAIKTKYPNKKVIIYSVIAEGNRFHNAFNLCDGCLSKDADPYQFECLVEKFTINRGSYE